MIRLPPGSTRTDTLFPYTTLFRSVILVLLVLTGAIALNLAGLFELPMPAFAARGSRTGGFLGAFSTGALAAFIAMPCSGPFMAGALGAALVLPAPLALAVFAMLGQIGRAHV